MRKKQLILWRQIFCLPFTLIQKTKFPDAIDVWVKRDDLNHPVIQGNKLRKLKYNIKHAIENECKRLVTFGGAYSNHVVATAQAGHLCGLATLGFIRGDELAKQPNKWSQTLLQAKSLGMKFIFLNRREYRLKEKSKAVMAYLKASKLKPYLIPEGGSNTAAIQGVKEIIAELQQQNMTPSHIICACGTGGTLAGLIEGVAEHKLKTKIVGIPVLKGADFLSKDIIELAPNQTQVQWQLNHDYHAGGFAKGNQKTTDFALDFMKKNNIALDKIYTAKTFYAAYDLIQKGKISPASSVLIIHTGGLQYGLNQV